MATRKEEIQKAIKLVGWAEVLTRIKDQGDREIFNELMKEISDQRRVETDKILKKNGISF